MLPYIRIYICIYNIVHWWYSVLSKHGMVNKIGGFCVNHRVKNFIIICLAAGRNIECLDLVIGRGNTKKKSEHVSHYLCNNCCIRINLRLNNKSFKIFVGKMRGNSWRKNIIIFFRGNLRKDINLYIIGKQIYFYNQTLLHLFLFLPIAAYDNNNDGIFSPVHYC